MNAPSIQSARVVVLALAGGTLLVAVMLAFLRGGVGVDASAGNGPLLGYLVPLLALANAAVYVVLRRSLLARARARRDENRALLREERLPPELFQLTLIGGALAEAVGLFGAVACFLGAHPLLLAAPLLACGLILAQLPGRERCEGWLRGE